MTHDNHDLFALLNQVQDEDFLKNVLCSTLQRLMDVDVSNKIQADLYDRSPKRLAHRNGYRPRNLNTRLGQIELLVPKLRQGSYFPGFLSHHKRSEQALISVIQEAYIQGVSTRKMDRIIQEMGLEGISKSQVSELCQSISSLVQGFLAAPLEGSWPYVFLDATYLKVRQGGRVVSKAAVIAIGINQEGQRHVLGLSLQDSEAATFWKTFLQSLKERGLRGVQLIISDAHAGLREAIDSTFPGSSWQRCWVHFLRNVLLHVPKTHHKEIVRQLRSVLAFDTLPDRERRWKELQEIWESQFPKLAQRMQEAQGDVLAHTSFPREHHAKIYSNNPIERLNREIKRRTNSVGIFPNDDAVYRLVGSILMQIDEDWNTTGKSYLNPQSLAGLA